MLLECSAFLELETLVALKGFQASPEDELMQLKYHLESKPEVPLDMADQFLWDLSQIHEVDARISCLIFQNNFQGRCEEIEVRINNLRSCCHFLSANPNLRNVLALILGEELSSSLATTNSELFSACGNFLNGGNRQRACTA